MGCAGMGRSVVPPTMTDADFAPDEEESEDGRISSMPDMNEGLRVAGSDGEDGSYTHKSQSMQAISNPLAEAEPSGR